MVRTDHAVINGSHAIVNQSGGADRAGARRAVTTGNGGLPGAPEEWDDLFSCEKMDYLFGKEPSPLATMAAEWWIARKPEARGALVDLGCGEGRDAVYYARAGFDVIAIDASSAALEKTARLAREAEVGMTRVQCDIRDYAVPQGIVLVHANNCLQFLGDQCLSYLRYLQQATQAGGLHAVSVMTRDAVPVQPGLFLFDHNELKCLYRGWTLLTYVEELLWREPDHRYLSFARIIALKV